MAQAPEAPIVLGYPWEQVRIKNEISRVLLREQATRVWYEAKDGTLSPVDSLGDEWFRDHWTANGGAATMRHVRINPVYSFGVERQEVQRQYAAVRDRRMEVPMQLVMAQPPERPTRQLPTWMPNWGTGHRRTQPNVVYVENLYLSNQ